MERDIRSAVSLTMPDQAVFMRSAGAETDRPEIIAPLSSRSTMTECGPMS